MIGQVLISMAGRREVRLHGSHVQDQCGGSLPCGRRAELAILLRPVVTLADRCRRPVAAGKASQVVGVHGTILTRQRALARHLLEILQETKPDFPAQ